MSELHTLEEVLIPPSLEVDEDDVMSLLNRTYALLETVLQGRLKATTRNDALRLHKDIEAVIWFHKVH